MTKRNLCRFRNSRMRYLVVCCSLFVVMAFGCSQNTESQGGGEETSGDQTTATQAGTTLQETSVAGDTVVQSPQEETQEQTVQQQQGQQQRQQDQQQQQAQQQQNQQQDQQQRNQDQQQDKQTITVRITGTEGLAFSGRLGSAQDLRRIEGSVPKEYEIPFGGAAVTATIRKQQPGPGTLGVEVVRDGEVVADKETSSTTGVLNTFWTPRQQGN